MWSAHNTSTNGNIGAGNRLLKVTCAIGVVSRSAYVFFRSFFPAPGCPKEVMQTDMTKVQKPTPVISNAPAHQFFVGVDVGYKTHVACACPGALFNTKRYPDGW